MFAVMLTTKEATFSDAGQVVMTVQRHHTHTFDEALAIVRNEPEATNWRIVDDSTFSIRAEFVGFTVL